jgi:hypothetical protein
MPLLDLKTDLKSLKYGSDRPGGGDSGQPYQKVDINTVDSGFNRFRMTNFDDGLVRGGVVGAANASIVDTLRIGKFLTDFPKGPLWIVKQVGLQLANPKLESKAVKTGIGFLDNVLNTLNDKVGIGPTRIYNLGINTLAQIPVNALGIHLNRHGMLPVQDDNTKYLAIAQNNNLNTKYTGVGLPKTSTNRLVRYASKLLPTPPPQNTRTSNLLQTALSLIPGASLFVKPQQQMIDEYVGGPGSVYGVGKTFIRRFDYTSNGVNKQQPQEKGKVNYPNTLGLSKQYFSALSPIASSPIFSSLGIGGLFRGTLGGLLGAVSAVSTAKNLQKYNNLDPSNPTNAPTNIDQATYSNVGRQVRYSSLSNGDIKSVIPPSTDNIVSIKNASYQTYQQIINSKQLSQNINYVNGVQANQFGIYGDITNKETLGKTLLPNSLSFPTYTDGNTVVKLDIPWNKVTREKRIGSGKQDKINLTPLFTADAGTMTDNVFIPGVGARKINDLVKFRIQAINTDNPEKATWMIFRAYITQFSDNTDATWNDIKYAGRGESFYIYNGFTRKIQIGFKVAALSAVEMQPMYQKLNYLMGNLMPDYDSNIMRGPLVRMTVGNWIDGQAGILNNISYTVPQDSPWEIAINSVNGVKPLVLPHIVEVNMTFTPIGSQTYTENKISKKDHLTSHIAQNINEKNNQYITGSSKIPEGIPSSIDADTLEAIGKTFSIPLRFK